MVCTIARETYKAIGTAFCRTTRNSFQESTTEADVTKLMIQAGFMERKRNKGTFYVVPTDELLGYAYRNKIDVSIFFEK